MRRPRYTAAARLDLLEIWSYIAQENVRAADRYCNRLKETVRRIGEFPEIGRRREELAQRLRSFPTKSHVIFYSTEE